MEKLTLKCIHCRKALMESHNHLQKLLLIREYSHFLLAERQTPMIYDHSDEVVLHHSRSHSVHS